MALNKNVETVCEIKISVLYVLNAKCRTILNVMPNNRPTQPLEAEVAKRRDGENDQKMPTVVLRVLTPCSLTGGYQTFWRNILPPVGDIHPEDGRSSFI
jgi:hypothetical protein